MANVTNAGNVVIKDNEPLNEIITTIRAVRDKVDTFTKERGEISEEIGVIRQSLDKYEKRLDDLDRTLPRGNRVYMADGPLTRTQAQEAFGEYITAAWHLKRSGKVPEGIITRTTHVPNQHEGSGPLSSDALTGQVLVPTPLYNEIDRMVGEVSLARPLCSTFSMSAATLKLPVRRSGPDVFIPGEGQQPAATSVVLDGVTLTAKTLMAIEEFTLELDEDSIKSMSSFLSTLFSESMGEAENKYCFSAQASDGGWNGVVQDIITANNKIVYLGGASNSGKTKFSAVTYTDLVNLMFKIDPKAIGRGVFVMSPMAFSHIVGLRQPTTDQPIFATAWQGLPGITPMFNPEAGTPTILLGRPCYVTNFMPSNTGLADTGYVVYGDFKKRAFGLRKDLSIEFSDQCFWATGGLGVRVRQRIAFGTTFTDSFALLKTSAT